MRSSAVTLVAVIAAFCPLMPREALAADPSGDALHFQWTEVSATEFRSPEPVYKTGSGNPCFRRIFIPEGIGDQKIQGIIVWDAEPHYHPKGPRSTIQSKLWRDFAARHRFGMAELATRPLSVEETVRQVQMIFDDMDRIYKRTECKHACFTFGGTSGTGHDTLELAAYEPIQERLIAGIPCSVTFQGSRGTFTLGNRIPLLIMPAGREERERSSAPRTGQEVAKEVRRGSPFTHAVRLSATHPQFRDDTHSESAQNRRIAHAMILATTWLESVFKQRLPEGEPPEGQSPRLRDLDPSKAWLATYQVSPGSGAGDGVDRGEQSTVVARFGHVLTDCKIGASDSLPGGRTAADNWFPDQTAAEAWKSYNQTGEVNLGLEDILDDLRGD